MDIQLSAGQGPRECELAVGKLLRSLKAEFPELVLKDTTQGKGADCFKSAVISCGQDLSFLEGTVKWICQSPYRPTHKRKNWFVDISLCHQLQTIDYDERLVRFETFRSPGKGGQHVNKVETGVRAVYIPTGLSVTSTEARSQYLNKQIALNRLCDVIGAQNYEDMQGAKALNRLEHSRIQRGNPVRVYEGLDFKRVY